MCNEKSNFGNSCDHKMHLRGDFHKLCGPNDNSLHLIACNEDNSNGHRFYDKC